MKHQVQRHLLVSLPQTGVISTGGLEDCEPQLAQHLAVGEIHFSCDGQLAAADTEAAIDPPTDALLGQMFRRRVPHMMVVAP